MRRDDLVRNLGVYLDELAALLESPRKRFSSLAEKDVPETAGLYIIYSEEAFEVFYAGKANKRKKPSAWGQPDGLRFRIMKNHLAYQGNDNFVKYVMEEFGLASRSDARNFIRKECSVHWLEVDDEQRLFVLEHLAIAALRPRFNRG
jgi:excinuclease UvrABC nuclease subunit